jgi:glycosyltransferase involved in cell wall biosynthesis
MRIAMIDPSLFTLPYDHHLCRAFHERGNSVMFFTRPLRPEEPDLEHAYWRSERFYRLTEDPRARRLVPGRARLPLKAVEHALGMAGLAADLRRLSPDVIHFQWLPVPLLDRVMVPLLRGLAPVFLTVHDTGGFLNPSSRLQLAGWPGLLASIDRLVVHLEASKRQLVDRGVAPGKIVVIPHGVLTLDDAAGDEPGPPPASTEGVGVGVKRILLFGAIKAYKGPDIMLRAFALLPPELRAAARVSVVGEPFVPLAQLQGLARELGIADRVDWDPRFVPDAELSTILRGHDVFAFPYRSIDASGVLMMSLPFERPIVATRVGCFGELLVDGETARLAPPEDPAAFAAALAAVLSDPKGAAEMAWRARRLALDTLSWDRIAARTEQAYGEAIGQGG